jgi:hypothetical protein
LPCARLYGAHERLTIPRDRSSPAADPEALALSTLGWVLADDDRAARLLALTGLTPEALRAGLTDPAVLGAVLDFVCGHEPDLILAAHELGVEPQALTAARERLA